MAVLFKTQMSAAVNSMREKRIVSNRTEESRRALSLTEFDVAGALSGPAVMAINVTAAAETIDRRMLLLLYVLMLCPHRGAGRQGEHLVRCLGLTCPPTSPGSGTGTDRRFLAWMGRGTRQRLDALSQLAPGSVNGGHSSGLSAVWRPPEMAVRIAVRTAPARCHLH